jgi:hypothetical protein
MERLLYPPLIFFMAVISGCGTTNSDKGSAVAKSAGEVFISPSAGTGASQVFSVQVPDIAEGTRSNVVRLLFNTEVDGRNACYLYFFLDSRSLALTRDSGEGAVNASVGAVVRLENSQCVVNAEKTVVAEDNGRMILRLPIDFKHSFAGKKNIYLATASDASQPASFRQVGEWVVP